MSIWEKIQFKYVCYRTLLWKHKSHTGLIFVIKRLVGLRLCLRHEHSHLYVYIRLCFKRDVCIRKDVLTYDRLKS